ncbi:MAG: flippase-like domain-containing protein [Sinobacterium sp.]|nr:flippase-like domain-containing protein [Sinobacterium sp.]
MNKLLHSSLVTIVFAVALYFGFTLYSGGEAVLQALSALPALTWLIILGLSLLNYLIRYWRWHLYIGSTHQSCLAKLSHARHLAIYIAGFALTMTPGKAGEAMRSLYLKQYGVAHQSTLAALFVERIMDLLAVLILALYGLSLLDDGQAQLATIVTASLVVGCIVAVKLPFEKILQWELAQRLPEKVIKLMHFAAGLLNNANRLLSVKFFIIGMGLGIVAWGLEGYGLHLVMQNYMPESIEISTSVAVYSIAVLLGAIAFLPGGIGGTEAAMMFMLVKLGFDTPSAAAITLICRIATLWFAIALGLIFMFLLSLAGMKPVLQEEL